MSTKMDRWKKRHDELNRSGGGGSINWWKEKEGQNLIRIVPGLFAVDPEADFWIERQKSFGVGPNNRVVTWPTEGSEAYSTFPLKMHMDELTTKDNPESKKRLNAMRRKTRVMMFVVDRNEEEKGFQLYDTNLLVLRDIIGIASDPDYGDISDPEKGTDITITYTPKEKTKSGFPDWQIVPKRHSTPLGHELTENLFEKFYVGEASDPEFVDACLKGKDKEWIEARKAERAAGNEDESEDEPEAEPVESEAPAGDEDAVVDKELEKVRARKKKASKKAPPKKKTKAKGLPKKIAEKTFDVSLDGDASELTGQEIFDRCQAGNPPDYVFDGDDWKEPEEVSEFFKASPAPAVSAVGADMDAALD